MRCGICNKPLIFTSQYRTIHQHTICKECIHRHSLSENTREALKDLLIPAKAENTPLTSDVISISQSSSEKDNVNALKPGQNLFRLREKILDCLPFTLKAFAVLYFIIHVLQFISQLPNYKHMDAMQLWYIFSNILYLFLFPLMLFAIAVLLQQLRILIAQITRVSALSAPVKVPVETEVDARKLD